MRWKKREKVERPKYPKLIAVAGTVDEAAALLPVVKVHDALATVLDGGTRGSFLKVHNEAAEAAATAETRTFPLV